MMARIFCSLVISEISLTHSQAYQTKPFEDGVLSKEVK